MKLIHLITLSICVYVQISAVELLIPQEQGRHKPLYVVGSLFPFGTVAIDVKLTNTSDRDPLLVSARAIGCSCLEILTPTLKLPPQSSASMRVIHSAGAWQGVTGSTLGLSWKSADGVVQELRLPIRVQVADYLADSATVSKIFSVPAISAKDPDANCHITVIRGKYPQGFARVHGSILGENLPWSVEVESVDADTWSVNVKPKGQLILGSQTVPIQFNFELADGSRLQRSVEKRMHVVVEGPVKTLPREVLIGTIAKGKEMKAVVRVRRRRGYQDGPFQELGDVIEHLTVNESCVSVRKGEANTCEISVRHDVSDKRKELRTDVIIHVQVEGQQWQIRVPVMALFAQ